MPFLAQYVYRKVLHLMVKIFTICNGFLIDRKIVTLTSSYNDRNTKNNRVYGHPAKFCVGKQKSHFLRFLRNIFVLSLVTVALASTSVLSALAASMRSSPDSHFICGVCLFVTTDLIGCQTEWLFTRNLKQTVRCAMLRAMWFVFVQRN